MVAPWCTCTCHPERTARVMVDDLVAWPGKPTGCGAARIFGNGKLSCHLTVDGPTVFLVPGWIALVSVVLLVRHPRHAFELDVAPAEADG